MKKCLFALIFIPYLAFTFNAPIVLDRHFSPYAASHDFLFIEREMLHLQNRYKDYLHTLKNPAYEKNMEGSKPALDLPATPSLSIGSRVLKRSLRLAELSLFWGPVNQIISTTQHEIFGHGYRIRDLGRDKAEVTGYKIALPYPFGKGGGSTRLIIKNQLPLSDRLLIDIAGSEAAQILAKNTTLSWLSQNRVDGRQSSLYTSAANELPLYILSLDNVGEVYYEHTTKSGHDIANYLMQLNYLYPSNESLKDQFNHLTKKAILSIVADPFNYYALAAKIQYIWSGKPLPMTTISAPVRFFMPTYRLALSPFGPEDVFGGYLLLQSGEPSHFYFKQGQFSKNTYIGFGFENQGVFQKGPSLFGLKFDFWHQPRLLGHIPENHSVYSQNAPTLGLFQDTKIFFHHEESKYTDKDLFEKKLGASFSFIYQYQFSAKKTNALYTQLGFKTSGYLPGESIRGGPILRFGMSLLF